MIATPTQFSELTALRGVFAEGLLRAAGLTPGARAGVVASPQTALNFLKEPKGGTSRPVQKGACAS
jgi:hypothetical protein